MGRINAFIEDGAHKFLKEYKQKGDFSCIDTALTALIKEVKNEQRKQSSVQ